ncbi:MAG TPA: asparagine synthase (glutamine-hydrolyzing), partial [Gaiellaceae bacterium]|nr:asparagine synthase (glutamine-hydrolyzing) [Gaiellaceae bacterium]
MCGICGIAPAAGAVDPGRIDAMSATLVHRGPDADGSFLDEGIALAARRLSIIDLEHGDQPLASEDGGVVVVQNGEIYNHGALRRELEQAGHRFATRCDTEVLAHGYEQWGDAFVERLRGMFALAVWDARRRRLLLARDRFGIKPLYWCTARGELSFASELRAFPRDEVDLDALEAFLAFNAIPHPLSIFRGVRKLEPGHLLVWEDGRARIERFARPTPVPIGALRREPVETLAAELRDRLADSVRAHLVSDVPVGVLLSGGIDSGLLAALAAEATGEPVRTFSIGFAEGSFDETADARLVADRYATDHHELVLHPDAARLLPALAAFAARESSYRVSTFSIGFEERSFNELELARRVAELYGTDHHELVLRPDAVELLPRLAEAFDEPFADSSALPTYLVSQLASGTVKVALSGEGGDELFGGYYTYVADTLAPRIGPLASVLRPLVERLPSSSSKASLDYKAKRFARAAHLPPLERHHGWKEIFTPAARADLLDGRRGEVDPLDIYRARYQETEGADELARLQDVDLGIYLADDLLVKTDRASMAHSLEARVPFCDQEVAELALALPRSMKVRRLAKKRLLRDAVASLLPREIVRGRKQGFSIPAAAWLRGDLEPFARELLSPDRMRAQGFFRPEAVTGLLDRHVSRKEDLS